MRGRRVFPSGKLAARRKPRRQRKRKRNNAINGLQISGSTTPVLTISQVSATLLGRSKEQPMAFGELLECSFFIPLRRDANLSDGALHPREAWDWLDNELFVRFTGGTRAPGEYSGF